MLTLHIILLLFTAASLRSGYSTLKHMTWKKHFRAMPCQAVLFLYPKRFINSLVLIIYGITISSNISTDLCSLVSNDTETFQFSDD